MPHDCEGRKIDTGDVVKTRPYNKYPSEPDRKVVGTVIDMHSTEQVCTGQIQFLVHGGPAIDYCSDYFGAGESELILKADGSEPKS